jgi:uncharacterized protein with HEPN domain
MSERAWRFYIDDMIDCAEHVLAYTAGLDQDGLVSDRLHYDATIRNLELIGEAATHLPDAVREENPQIPWRLAPDYRNAQSADTRLPWHRQRHPLEHHPDGHPGVAAEIGRAAGGCRSGEERIGGSD